MTLVTNLDRPAIEGQLGQLHAAVKGEGLADLAQLFSGAEGMPGRRSSSAFTTLRSGSPARRSTQTSPRCWIWSA